MPLRLIKVRTRDTECKHCKIKVSQTFADNHSWVHITEYEKDTVVFDYFLCNPCFDNLSTRMEIIDD